MSYRSVPTWQTPVGYRPGVVLARHNRLRRTRTATPLPFRRTTDPAHGTTTGYWRGCGCPACCHANTEAQRAKRKGMAT